MILVIFGSRTFTDYDLLCRECDRARGVTLVLCGCAKGADNLGKQWANERGIEVRDMPADWENLGKVAGRKRNIEMATICDMGLGFWDGKTTGTKHMIGRLKAFNKPSRIIKFIPCKFDEFMDNGATGTLEDLLC